MSIRFECVSCKKSLIVHDRFLGKSVRCPKCNERQKVQKQSTDLKQPTNSFGFDLAEGGIASGRDRQETISQLETASESGKDVPHVPPKRERMSPRQSEDDLEWDITPMVDVAFLLLIFFMLTAAFSVQKAIPASAKDDRKSASARRQIDQLEKITIQIDENNSYTVISSDGEIVEATNKQDLIIQLDELLLQLGEVAPLVLVQAHELSIHGSVVACMDAARQAGFTSFQLESVEDF